MSDSWKEIDVQFSKSLFFLYWLYLSYLPWYNCHGRLGFKNQLSLPLLQSALSRKLHQRYIFLQEKVTPMSCWTSPWKLKPYSAKWLGPDGLLFVLMEQKKTQRVVEKPLCLKQIFVLREFCQKRVLLLLWVCFCFCTGGCGLYV